MPIVLLIIAAYVAAVLDTSLADLLRIGHAMPDLVALTAAVWLLTASGKSVFVGAAMVALLGDLIAPGHLGVGMACMLLVGYAVARLRPRLPSNHLAVQLAGVLVVVTVWAMATTTVGRVLGDVTLPWPEVPTRAVAVGLYTMGVSFPVLMVVGWIREPGLARQRRIADC